MNEEKEKTIFEKIIDREIPAAIVFENDHVISFLDINPFEKGHILIVPKKPFSYIWEMPEEDYLELQKAVLLLAKNMREKMQCEINLVQNNGLLAHQDVFHVHFHLIPRTKNKWLYKKHTDTDYNDSYINDEEKQKYLDILKIS